MSVWLYILQERYNSLHILPIHQLIYIPSIKVIGAVFIKRPFRCLSHVISRTHAYGRLAIHSSGTLQFTTYTPNTSANIYTKYKSHWNSFHQTAILLSESCA